MLAFLVSYMSISRPPPPLSILIADDSSTIRRFVVNALQSAPVTPRIVEAVDGTSCLEELSKGQFDVAFVDVNMPGLSGMEALAEARRKGVTTFVVIMSSETDRTRLAFARTLGAYDYLSKPFAEQGVSAILENYVRFTKPTSALLVDDSSATRAVIKRVMEDSLFKLQIDEAADGASAIVAYQSGQHDIVFLDINMPGLNGIDTLETLRKVKAGVKVALMTAELDRSLAEGAFDVLLYKPFFAEDVDQALHTLFGLRPPSLVEAGPEPDPAPEPVREQVSI
jgi:CheY-like chemotaxis protein